MEQISAPTPIVWIIGRTQTNGPTDDEAGHHVPDGFTVTPLSRFGTVGSEPPVVIDSDIDMTTPPLTQLGTMSAREFFRLGLDLVQTTSAHPTDWSMLARMARIGLVSGAVLDLDQLDPAVGAALDDVPPATLAAISALVPHLGRWPTGGC